MYNWKLLLVEDSPSLSILYQEYLKKCDCDITAVNSGEDALLEIKKRPPQLLILDLNLPDINGMLILKYIQDENVNCEVIVITAYGSVDIAVEAMKYGVFDFLTKPFDAKRLQVTVRNALKHEQLNSLVHGYREHYERQDFHGFIGASLPMQGVYRIIESAAQSTATVFITGDSGTGKELCAEALHQQSSRKKSAFVALNCAAIPKDLMESEIFGHVKGAFTGASNDRKGAASMADGGTLFLDELCEMDIDLQSKILRFVQTGTFTKVGSGKVEKVDVRFVCATNRDPLKEVQKGKLREDLYYRLHVIPIVLPPLCERGEDILLIARRLLLKYSKEENKDFKSFDRKAEEILLTYKWPGNIRQLQNVIRNLVVLNEGSIATAELFPPPLNQLFSEYRNFEFTERAANVNFVYKTPDFISAQHISEVPSDLPKKSIKPLLQVEKKAIEDAIEFCQGNIPKAAALLEVSPSTIYRKKQNWQDVSTAH